METIELEVKGMSCKSCSDKIEKALRKKKGVQEVKAELAEDKVRIVFDPEEAKQADLEQEVASLGYSTKNFPAEKGPQGEGKKTLLQGITYGLVPHLGCFGFIIASVLGITFAAEFFKPLLLNAYFFYGLIALSIVFATISSVLYLKKHNLLSFKGVRKKKLYLGTMYGSTIGVSLLLLIVIFPLLATISYATPIATETQLSGTALGINTPGTGPLTPGTTPAGTQMIKLQVQIPCGGHTPLITSELKKVIGVISVKTPSWDTFEVTFDTAKTTQEKILQASIFKSYPAKVL